MSSVLKIESNRFHSSNFIHPTAIVDPLAELGRNNYFGPYCIVGPNVKIGDNNRFEAFCSIGLVAEHTKYWNSPPGKVLMGNDCVVREYVTIHAGTTQATEVSNKVYLLRGSHVGHDSIIEENVTVSCNVMIGGHSYIFKGANLGLSAVLHQYSVIGHYAMLGMGCVVTKKTEILPAGIFVGNPARHLKTNSIALSRNNISEASLETLLQEFRQKKTKSETR